MSLTRESRNNSEDSAPLTQDTSCERNSEVSANAAIVLRRTTRVEQKDDTSTRRKYSVTVCGENPLNLVEKISSVHAAAIVQMRQQGLTTPTTPQRESSKVTNKRERSVHVQPKNDSNL